jgi:hypothetical protein
MCCQRVCTASATAACSPKALAPTTSRARELLAKAKPNGNPSAAAVDPAKPICPCCGGHMIIIEIFAVQHHGISQQVQQPSLGSTPHDRVTLLRIFLSRSLALDRPQQSSARYPSVVTNRPTTCRLRHHPSLAHQPLYRRTPRRIGSVQIGQLARDTPHSACGTTYAPLSAVSLEAFGRRPPNTRRRPSSGRHPKPFATTDSNKAKRSPLEIKLKRGLLSRSRAVRNTAEILSGALQCFNAGRSPRFTRRHVSSSAFWTARLLLRQRACSMRRDVRCDIRSAQIPLFSG